VQRGDVGKLQHTHARDHVPAQHLGVALRCCRLYRALYARKPLLQVAGNRDPAGIRHLVAGLALGREAALPLLLAPTRYRIAADVDDVRPAAASLDD
jgi:hypothetical protein